MKWKQMGSSAFLILAGKEVAVIQIGDNEKKPFQVYNYNGGFDDVTPDSLPEFEFLKDAKKYVEKHFKAWIKRAYKEIEKSEWKPVH